MITVLTCDEKRLYLVIYGKLSLSKAREKLLKVKKLANGLSPAKEKQREKQTKNQ